MKQEVSLKNDNWRRLQSCGFFKYESSVFELFVVVVVVLY